MFISVIISGCSEAPKKETPKPSADNTAKVSSHTPGVIPRPNEIAKPKVIEAKGTIQVAFSPNGGAQEMIIKTIDQAKKSIKVQAYIFTNADIAKALLDAHKRGVNISVILDASQSTSQYTSATFFSNAGIPVRIDDFFQHAHNKVIIIDDEVLITGSYNFSKAAEERNAENVLVFRGNQELVNAYLKNWHWRWNASKEYKKAK